MQSVPPPCGSCHTAGGLCRSRKSGGKVCFIYKSGTVWNFTHRQVGGYQKFFCTGNAAAQQTIAFADVCISAVTLWLAAYSWQYGKGQTDFYGLPFSCLPTLLNSNVYQAIMPIVNYLFRFYKPVILADTQVRLRPASLRGCFPAAAKIIWLFHKITLFTIQVLLQWYNFQIFLPTAAAKDAAIQKGFVRPLVSAYFVRYNLHIAFI